MKKKWICLLIVMLLLSGCAKQDTRKVNTPKVIPVIWYPPEWESQEPPENRIELLRFHHTIECEDCRMVGEMVLYILQNTFPEEAKKGIIIYRDSTKISDIMVR